MMTLVIDLGCMESNWADNYDELATSDNGSCSLGWHVQNWADNYDPNATINDTTCYND